MGLVLVMSKPMAENFTPDTTQIPCFIIILHNEHDDIFGDPP
jgi:hypothetical protein